MADLPGRRDVQTESDEALPAFHGPSKMGGEAVRTEVTVRLSVWRGVGATARPKMVGVHSLKLNVRAGVLELGHGAWRHEMGMGDGDGECVLPRVQGALSLSVPAAKSDAAGPLCLLLAPRGGGMSYTACTGQSRDHRSAL